ncbi:MAG TPA: response regulator, partial [Tissierellaceae bacterium]|nr:response regulator [Tissierellaceae bacterium]
MKIKDPDVLFLDIEMGPINGLEISEYFLQEKESLEIIFVTAYPQYAVGAFEIDAIDYLLKPVQKSRLDMAIKRLKERLSTSAYSSSKKINRDLRINSFGSFQVLDRENKPLVWRTKKGKELFAYLWAQEGQPATRDQVMEHVFSHIDNNRGSALLHTTIYQIRKGLSNLGYLDGIIYTNDGYKLNLPITSDLDDLTTILKKEKYNRDDIIEILE